MSLLTIHRIFPSAIPPMRADKSALGSLPAAAFQYCEAVRAASSFGWYVFPPSDITLKFDGVDVFSRGGDKWSKLTALYFDEEYWDYWDQNAPDEMKGYRIPYVTSLFVPGVIQIWSGLLVSTAPDYSVLVRPLSNVIPSRSHLTYEGLIETDRFAPCPLFINMKLVETDRVIAFDKTSPLFQIQPIHRSCYASDSYKEFEGLLPDVDGVVGMSVDDWNGLRTTIRSAQPVRDDQIGGYGAAVRRRAKTEGGSA